MDKKIHSDMKKYTYRDLSLKISLFVIICVIIFSSCDDDKTEYFGDPSIEIVTESGFVSTDTIIAVNQVFKFKIHAEWNGHNRLVNLIVKMNDDRYLDLGFYEKIYDRVIEVPKGLEDVETWEFIIRDMEGNFATAGLTITKDPNIVYGEITDFSGVQLGAQDNTEYGGFLSFSNGNIYNLEEAFNNQSMIDMVYYYDNFENLEENIISSPGGNIDGAFSGTYGVSNWTTRNTIRYSRSKLDITTDEFDQALNDSLIIANTFAFESGGRKTKYLKPGDMYAFVREDNRAGIFKVVSTSGATDGYIIVDIKLQKD